jgi:DNA-3-methyladenine glycosylase I
VESVRLRRTESTKTYPAFLPRRPVKEKFMSEHGPPPQIEPKSLDDYLEVMSKGIFQAGISWRVVEAKWPGIRSAFENFEVHKVADFDERDIEKLSQDHRVIRNQRKLEAIVGNARRMIALDKEYGSFRRYLRSHGDFEATLNAMRKDFKFMGPMATYYFLYVVGEDVPSHEDYQAKYRK